MGLLMMWILYAVVGVIIFSLFFLWAIRARQFSDQDRARYLPLRDPDDQDDQESDGDAGGSEADGDP